MPTTSRGPSGRAHPSGPRVSTRGRARSTGSARAGEGTDQPEVSKPSEARRPTRPTSSTEAVSAQSGTQATAELSRPPVRSSATTRAAVLLGVLAILAASYALPVRAWLDQRAQLAAVAEQRDALAAEVAELRDAVALWQDPAYVRAQARERLNYVEPGEVGLVVLGTESTPPPEPVSGVVVPEAAQDQPWWSTLVSAFSEVGNASRPVEGEDGDDAEIGS